MFSCETCRALARSRGLQREAELLGLPHDCDCCPHCKSCPRSARVMRSSNTHSGGRLEGCMRRGGGRGRWHNESRREGLPDVVEVLLWCG